MVAISAEYSDKKAAQVYQISIGLAAQGKLSEAIISLQAASAILPSESTWRTRMVVAAQLLRMRQEQLTSLPSIKNNTHLSLAANYIKHHPHPEVSQIWPVGLLATVFPGAGHAWQGRWNDAGVAAMFVWHFLILTL